MESYLVPRRQFSVEDGIAVQTENLNAWKLVLKDDVYKRVEEWAKETNSTVKDGYQVRRGETISCYISNISTEMYYGKQNEQ